MDATSSSRDPRRSRARHPDPQALAATDHGDHGHASTATNQGRTSSGDQNGVSLLVCGDQNGVSLLVCGDQNGVSLLVCGGERGYRAHECS